MGPRRIEQASPDARIEIDLDAGCRLSSLQVAGHELLVTAGPGPIEWGCYPMAPYAGRVRQGRFVFGGIVHELPRTLGGHAVHGTVYVRRWEQEAATSFVSELGADWPFRGHVRQEISLQEGELTLRLEVHADAGPMPASCGWHPWFHRTVAGAAAVLDFRPGYMLDRDAEGIASRVRRPVTSGPWDDCFGDVRRPPVLTWPGVLRLEIDSTCDYWVVFTERDHAWCIEPQTAPPDALNHDPFVAEPGRPLIAAATLRWTLP